MQGKQAAKFYFRAKGKDSYTFIGFLTKLPGDLTVPHDGTAAAIVGDIRAIFSEDNTEIGGFSDSTEITLS